jgi:hypothetical protein
MSPLAEILKLAAVFAIALACAWVGINIKG